MESNFEEERYGNGKKIRKTRKKVGDTWVKRGRDERIKKGGIV